MTSSTWAIHRARGYGVAYAVLIEGIPYTFADRRGRRADTGAEPSAATGTTLSRALSLTVDDAVSCDADRRAGVASGRSLDLTLAWDELVAEGLTTGLFAAPTLRARLATAITAAATTTVEVDSTTGWPSSGSLYLGRERLTYSGTTSTSFTGCTRGTGAQGLAHYHRADATAGYAEVADRPVYWRGRHVTLYEHLVAPDGRVLPTTWATVASDVCRELWRGYVAAEPTAGPAGISLRVLPLERLVGEAVIGGEVMATALAWTGDWSEAIVPPGSQDRITVTVTRSGGTDSATVPTNPAVNTATTVTQWMWQCERDLQTAFSGLSWATADPVCTLGFVPAYGGGTAIKLTVRHDGTVTGVVVMPEAWFLAPEPSRPGVFATGSQVTTIFDLRTPRDGGWLPVRLSPSEDGEYPSVPSSGYVRVGIGDRRMVARYDATSALPARPSYLAIHISAIAGFTIGGLWSAEGELAFVAGAAGTVAEVFETLLSSSGLASARGSYDTLGHGLGLGVPSAYLDTARLRGYPLDAEYAVAVSDGAVSVGELLGGWLALHQLCIVQRQTSLATGDVRLTVVDTAPGALTRGSVFNPAQLEVVDASVALIGGDGAGAEPVEAPNQIRIGRLEGGREAVTVVSDRARVQAEGAVTWELAAPGVSLAGAGEAGWALIALGRGNVTTVDVPGWVDLQVGDALLLETAHGGVYDYAAGARAPGSISARILGLERRLVEGVARLTLLLDAGTGSGLLWLCPCAYVTSKSGSTVDVSATSRDTEWFADGESVLLYNAGAEATESQTLVIDTVAEDGITFTTTPAAWVAAGTVITYPVYTSASARQQGVYLYVSSVTRWR